MSTPPRVKKLTVMMTRHLRPFSAEKAIQYELTSCQVSSFHLQIFIPDVMCS